MQDVFSNPLTEAALPFLLSSIPLFNNFNKLLQSEKPIIHMLHNSIKARVIDGEVDGEVLFHYRVDVLWRHIARFGIPETASKQFTYLPNVAELVLVLPHSNAGKGQLFSIVRKNKTENSRSSLKLEGTLSNLLAIKLQYLEQTVPCHNWRPGEELFEGSKKAASAYMMSSDPNL